MLDINKITLLGRLGQDPEVKMLDGGRKVAKFTLATTERWKGNDGDLKEYTEWHTIEVWGKLVDVVGKYLKKGSPLYLEGKLRTEKWEDKEGNKRSNQKVVALEINLLPSGSGNTQDLQEYINSLPDADTFKKGYAEFRKKRKNTPTNDTLLSEVDELPF